MTDTSPEVYLRDMLRVRLVDPNATNRVSGTQYIAARFPYETNLVTNNYPRISISNQFSSARSFGIGSSVMWKTPRLQIDISTKPDQPLTIDGTTYTGVEQVSKIADDIEYAIQHYWISDLALTGKLIILQSLNWYLPKMNYDMNLWRIVGDITFSNIQI